MRKMSWIVRCGCWTSKNVCGFDDTLRVWKRYLQMHCTRSVAPSVKEARYFHHILKNKRREPPEELHSKMVRILNENYLWRQPIVKRRITVNVREQQVTHSSHNNSNDRKAVKRNENEHNATSKRKREKREQSSTTVNDSHHQHQYHRNDVERSPMTSNQSEEIGQRYTKHYRAPGGKPNKRMSEMSKEDVGDNIRSYLFTRFFNHFKNYDKILETKFPSTVKMYRTFFDGIREFIADMKRFVLVTRIISTKGIKALNRRELELYLQMQNDMIKIAPVLLFSALPLVGYMVLPLAFIFPRRLLTNQFWNEEQRLEFKQLELKERLKYYDTLLCCLQEKGRSLVNHRKFSKYQEVLTQLKNGSHPTVDELLNIKDIFSESTFNLITLSRKHIKFLVRIHDASRSLLKRHSLYEHAFLVHYMDLAILREGGVHNMSTGDLRNACFIRGLNPTDLSNDELINWLREWIKVSTSITSDQLTMYLHLPLFLAHNHSNNTKLLRDTT